MLFFIIFITFNKIQYQNHFTLFFMAVPKKKMSKSRRDSRKSYWKKKVVKNVLIAISLGKSIKSGKPNNFVLDKRLDESFIYDQTL
jgi:large subunit ribosomal protein L32